MALGPTCGSVDRFAHEIPYMADLCRKNQHFWSRHLNYPRFFALFLDLLGHVLEFLSWTLRKMGARSNLVVGGSLHVIESTSFSSPTGFPEPPQTPGDLPGPPQGGLENLLFFLNFFKKSSRPREAQVRANLLAVTRCRFAAAGDGSPEANVVS